MEMQVNEKAGGAAMPVLRVKELTKTFSKDRSLVDLALHKDTKTVHAVNNVSMDVYKGEVVGIVGESGCGKSTLARTILQLNRADSGEIWYEGRDITKLPNAKAHKECIGIQMVFQDPYASLNPKMTVRQCLTEILKVHHLCAPQDRENRLQELMRSVGLGVDSLEKYPSEFSGGQRQRIGIARALALNPEVIVADEPVSALDVSIQAQIINLLKELQQKLQLTVLFISHDLSVVRYIADRVNVMYLGEIIESGETEELFTNPRHPYTQALLNAVPKIGGVAADEDEVLNGEPPSPVNLPEGCFFAARCAHCTEECKKIHPQLQEITEHHWTACIHAQEIPAYFAG